MLKGLLLVIVEVETMRPWYKEGDEWLDQLGLTTIIEVTWGYQENSACVVASVPLGEFKKMFVVFDFINS